MVKNARKDELKELEKAAMVVVGGVPPWLATAVQRLADLGTPEAELLRDWIEGRLRDKNGEVVEFSPGSFGQEVSAAGYDLERAKEALRVVGITDKESMRDFEKGVDVEMQYAWGEISEEEYKKLNEEFQKRWAERLSEPEHSPKRHAPAPGR